MKKIIVTGASKGLGLAITKKLLVNDNYSVIAISRSCSEELRKLLDSPQLASRLKIYEFDFSVVDQIKEFSRDLVKENGVPYALVNNAALGFDGVLGTMHESQIIELIKVNFTAPVLLTKYISRSMLLNQKGRIINISSIIADTGFNGLSVYGGTKAALNGFTRSLSRELGKIGITVNSVAPGYMETAMTSSIDEAKLDKIKNRSPSGRLASVDDVAATVSFLLSPEAESINGVVYTVDAGSTA